jgi:uncharacterized RDD family membrane protein YckC
MAMCIHCGAVLPSSGDCTYCAERKSRQRGVPPVPARDLQLDRRYRPGLPPPLPPAHATPLSPPLPGPPYPGYASNGAPPPLPKHPAPSEAKEVDPWSFISSAPSAPANVVSRPAGGILSRLAPRAPQSPTSFAPIPRAPQTLPSPPATPAPAPRAEPLPSASPLLPVAAPRAEPLPHASAPLPAPTPAAEPAFASAPIEPPPVAPVAKRAKPSTATRAGEEIHARPAALWRRIIATVIDAALLAGIVGAYFNVAARVVGAQAEPSGMSGLDALAHQLHAWNALLLPGAVLTLVLGAVYAGAFAVLWGGRTPGRLLTGIRLVDASGYPPGPWRAGVRAILSLFSFILLLGGFWLALFDRRGQTLHDKLTRTFVVQPS